MQRPARNDYDLTPVRCPGSFYGLGGDRRPCPQMIDRREVELDRAVHEAKCKTCNCLYVYRFSDDGRLVVLSMQEPPPKKGRR